jgi:methylmalonyl-CoA/ethylmalonyl-CoA epimerase
LELTFDHIGVVVADVDASASQLAATFGAQGFTKKFDDAGLGVSVRFVRDPAGVIYEMIAPLGERSPVAKTLAKQKDLLNQVAYLVHRLEESGDMLRANGCLTLGAAKPAPAFGGAHVQFFWNPLGFVVELIEGPEFRHQFFASIEEADRN